MSTGIVVQPITAGFTITPVLSGPLQVKVLTRILPIVAETTLQGIVCKGEVNHLQGLILQPVNPDRILTEVPEAILCRQEAVIPQVLMVVLLLAVADLPHLIADLLDPAVLPHQDLPHQDLPLVLHLLHLLHLAILLQAGDS